MNRFKVVTIEWDWGEVDKRSLQSELEQLGPEWQLLTELTKEGTVKALVFEQRENSN